MSLWGRYLVRNVFVGFGAAAALLIPLFTTFDLISELDNVSAGGYRWTQAVAVVLKNRRASISLVQRHLRIGYNRAARLLEQMEQSGVVSTMQSNGNREILVPAASSEQG